MAGELVWFAGREYEKWSSGRNWRHLVLTNDAPMTGTFPVAACGFVMYRDYHPAEDGRICPTCERMAKADRQVVRVEKGYITQDIPSKAREETTFENTAYVEHEGEPFEYWKFRESVGHLRRPGELLMVCGQEKMARHKPSSIKRGICGLCRAELNHQRWAKTLGAVSQPEDFAESEGKGLIIMNSNFTGVGTAYEWIALFHPEPVIDKNGNIQQKKVTLISSGSCIATNEAEARLLAGRDEAVAAVAETERLQILVSPFGGR